jgi:exopolyphosphatase / guanosine-5'-triphosphate,3'-diphosphate pyrophosphatase
MVAETAATWMPDLSAPGPGRVGVVDIGSNTVRLVVYDAPTRLPIPIFNEKAECGLVRGLAETGKLYPEGVTEAIRSLRRFNLLSKSMGVERLALVATAAVREADDGPDFVERVDEIFGVPVRVVSGNEEARLSAIGALSGYPEADGLLADLGGGSFDFMEMCLGGFGNSGSVPLGHLRVMEAADGSMKAARKLVSKNLESVSWLSDISDRTLYLAGGSCRALARVFIHHQDYPLHVIDGFTIRRNEVSKLSNVLAAASPSSMGQVMGVSMSRQRTLPFAAAVVEGLLKVCDPKDVVFCGFGMREGQLLDMLPPAIRGQDPFLAGCARTAERTGRFTIAGEEIYDWMAPLFPQRRDAVSRIRMAACMLSDIGWSEHPDYRAEHAFLRVLRLPFAGLTHHDRVLLALSIFVRYDGDADNPVAAPVRSLLTDEEIDTAEAVGKALRLAHNLSGSAPGLLPGTRFKIKDDVITLVLLDKDDDGRDIFISEAIERRLSQLAKSLNKTARFD